MVARVLEVRERAVACVGINHELIVAEPGPGAAFGRHHPPHTREGACVTGVRIAQGGRQPDSSRLGKAFETGAADYTTRQGMLRRD
jgi:hypothetical protein